MTASISKALIVDDSRMARATLAKLLNKRSIEVDVAESGQGALDYMATNEPPDAVFMDYIMQDMDGIETVRRIRESEGDVTPFAMYSSQEGIEEQAHQHGVRAFITKPASDRLVGEVLTQLSSAAATRAAPVDGATGSEAERQPPADAPTPVSFPGDAAPGVANATAASPSEGAAGPTGVTTGAWAAATESSEPTGPTTTAPESPAWDAPQAGNGHESKGPTESTAPSTRHPSATSDASIDAAQGAPGAVSAQQAPSTPEARAGADTGNAEVTGSTGAASQPTATQAGHESNNEIEGHVETALQSRAAAKRIAQVFLQTAWPKVRARVVDEITESLRDDMRRIAHEAAAETGRQGTVEADASSGMEERIAALRAELNKGMAQSIDRVEARLKRLIIAVAAGLSAVVAVGFTVVLVIG